MTSTIQRYRDERATTPYRMRVARKVVREHLAAYRVARAAYRMHPDRARHPVWGYDYPHVGQTYDVSCALAAALDARKWWTYKREDLAKLETLRASLNREGA